MRRKRARRESTSISLFPFLAVLICTMGALIVLLVIVVKQADVSAQARRNSTQQETQAEIAKLQERLEEAEFVATEVATVRPELVEQVREATMRRSHYEQQSRELLQRWEELQAQAATIRNPDSLAANDLSVQIDQLEQELAELQSQVEQARQQRGNEQPVYALVAYDGRNGTRRRPILIECSPQGIDLQPFGIHLDLTEFTDPILPGNPLDAAVLAIRDRWNQQDPRGSAGAPYPLILVRPNGSQAYAVVREALKSWDSEFGHQIIPQEMQLVYPENDPRLSEELRTVIDQAKLRQVQMLAAMGVFRSGGQGSGGSGSGAAAGGGLGAGGSAGGGNGTGTSGQPDFVLRASGRHGGFVDTSGRARSTPAQSISQTAPSSDSANSELTGGESNEQGNSNSQTDSSQFANASGNNSQTLGWNTPQTDGQAMGPSRPGGSSGGEQGNASAVGNASSIRPLSESRGGEWALPVRSSGSVAYHRPIRMRCLNDRLQILSEDQPNKVLAEYPYAPDVASSIDPLVDQLWKQIDSWGTAGYRAYWKPELRIDVAPDARPQFDSLTRLLDGSGLAIKEVRR